MCCCSSERDAACRLTVRSSNDLIVPCCVTFVRATLFLISNWSIALWGFNKGQSQTNYHWSSPDVTVIQAIVRHLRPEHVNRRADNTFGCDETKTRNTTISASSPANEQREPLWFDGPFTVTYICLQVTVKVPKILSYINDILLGFR